MRDVPPPQVPQGLIRQQEEKEEEGCEPHQEGLQPQGAQGWQPMLGQCLPHATLSPVSLYFLSKLFCCKTHVSVMI